MVPKQASCPGGISGLATEGRKAEREIFHLEDHGKVNTSQSEKRMLAVPVKSEGEDKQKGMKHRMERALFRKALAE